MGKGKSLITKQGRSILNPTDAYRRQLRKKELKRNAKSRKQGKEWKEMKKDPNKILQEIERLKSLNLKSDKIKERRKVLENLHAKVLQQLAPTFQPRPPPGPPPPQAQMPHTLPVPLNNTNEGDDDDDDDDDSDGLDEDAPPLPPQAYPGGQLHPLLSLPGVLPSSSQPSAPPPPPPRVINSKPEMVAMAPPSITLPINKKEEEQIISNPALMLSMIPPSVAKQRLLRTNAGINSTTTNLKSRLNNTSQPKTLASLQAPTIPRQNKLGHIPSILSQSSILRRPLSIAPDIDNETPDDQDFTPVQNNSMFFSAHPIPIPSPPPPQQQQQPKPQIIPTIDDDYTKFMQELNEIKSM